MENLMAGIQPILSLNMYSPLLGVLIGVFVTYKLTVDRDRLMVASEAYKTVYGSLFMKLSTIKINIEIKQKEYGKRNFRKLNKQCKKNKNITLIAKQILDVSDEIHKTVKVHDHSHFSAVVISRYYAVDQIREQLRLAEISDLGFGEDEKFRESRITRLNYELALAKIALVQGILEDLKKISAAARIKDRETKATIRFLLKTCKAARKNGVLKKYRIAVRNDVKRFEVQNIPAS